jgi:hypothetical protein
MSKIITEQDLHNIYIDNTSVTLADAEDHTFKNWLRSTLIANKLVPNQIETDYVVPVVDRVIVLNELVKLGVNFDVKIAK